MRFRAGRGRICQMNCATPADKLEGRKSIIFAECKRKLAAVRHRRSLAHSLAEPRAPQLSEQT